MKKSAHDLIVEEISCIHVINRAQIEDSPGERSKIEMKPEIADACEAKKKLNPSVRWIIDLSMIDDRTAAILLHAGVTNAPLLMSMVRRSKLEFSRCMLELAAKKVQRSVDELFADIKDEHDSDNEDTSRKIHYAL